MEDKSLVNFLALVYSKFLSFCCQHTYLDFTFVLNFDRLDRQQCEEGPGRQPVIPISKDKIHSCLEVNPYQQWIIIEDEPVAVFIITLQTAT